MQFHGSYMHVWSAFRLKYLNEIRNIDCHIVNGRYATVQVNVVVVSISLSLFHWWYVHIHLPIVGTVIFKEPIRAIVYTHIWQSTVPSYVFQIQLVQVSQLIKYVSDDEIKICSPADSRQIAPMSVLFMCPIEQDEIQHVCTLANISYRMCTIRK